MGAAPRGSRTSSEHIVLGTKLCAEEVRLSWGAAPTGASSAGTATPPVTTSFANHALKRHFRQSTADHSLHCSTSRNQDIAHAAAGPQADTIRTTDSHTCNTQLKCRLDLQI